ncbi:hypothetical protein AVEN_241360-1 [Araneus ventricosus]|uniref:Uncharacterized protein n=1 Tax=Araneus ventricosus TaxID=182803 RepID=A0A4Y2IEB7_ARAVE|nr:hypothetical protein AVEN_241360-1 [Araneus ventricosus]
MGMPCCPCFKYMEFKGYGIRPSCANSFRLERSIATHQKLVVTSRIEAIGQRGIRSSGTVFNRLKNVYDRMMENCYRRKFKPIGCDFDGDVVHQECLSEGQGVRIVEKGKVMGFPRTGNQERDRTDRWG